MEALIQAVRDHALAHYADGGWDVVVECYGDSEIAEVIAGATTPKQAIAAFRDLVDVWTDRQQDAVNCL
jgi:hypothetical protein